MGAGATGACLGTAESVRLRGGGGVPVYAAVPTGYVERYTALHHPGVWLWEGEPHQAQSRALNHVRYGVSLVYEEGTWVKLAVR